MKTDELIRALATDRRGGMPLPRRLTLALAGGLAATLVAFLVGLGLRADIVAAAGTVRFLLKPALTLLLAAAALVAVLRLARPDGQPAGLATLLLLAPLALAVAIAVELAVTPAASWGTRLVGSNAGVCLVAIPLLALAPLAAMLAVLRRGAPMAPMRLGMAAGLAAGALAAAFYAVHCPDDSPLFVATWYGTAIAVTTAAGGLAGRRLLRW
ncbi:hypothetical protein EDC65_2203 [Stella humosa]|uniref:DUF1109 family protein n=1 Tax=Stella humosa TaxID=94 RepID=A0A3N1MGV9_9PROT|nr:NrsF family protein [Stella humosa]ROQ00406.1 hypothetical protein EDC65_2203 [Stella humosa]BBK30351.1 hypothetical protein STHU_09850 [Stella humosa]